MATTLTIERLAFVATLIGLIRIATVARNVNRTRNVESYNLTSTLMGLITSLIWLVYDYTKNLKLGMLTAGATVCLDTYILHLLLQERKNDKRG
jgi:uncharacterized protein with PQ loop repeat